MDMFVQARINSTTYPNTAIPSPVRNTWTVDIGDMFRALIRNDQAMTVVISIVLINCSIYLTSNLVIYFFKYDFGGEGWQNAYTLFNTFGRHISTAVKAKKTATISANHLNPILSFPFPRRYTACMVITVTSALPMPAHVLPRVERPSRSLLSLAKAGIMDQ